MLAASLTKIVAEGQASFDFPFRLIPSQISRGSEIFKALGIKSERLHCLFSVQKCVYLLIFIRILKAMGGEFISRVIQTGFREEELRSSETNGPFEASSSKHWHKEWELFEGVATFRLKFNRNRNQGENFLLDQGQNSVVFCILRP